MQRIPIDQLRLMWKEEGFWGPWRERLKSSYAPGELYFEFGLVPEPNRQRGDYRIVLDHEVHVQLSPSDISLRGQYVIKADPSRAGEQQVDANHKYHTLFVTDAEYAEFLNNASRIYAEYKDEDIGCFWSIPKKWFSDLQLIRFLADRIVLTEDYRNRPRTRQDWYWP